MRTSARLLLSLWLLSAATATAQLGLETLHLRRGDVIKGEVTEIRDDSVVIVHRKGRGSVRQAVSFDKIKPNSLYALLISALAPLDRAAHARIADVAFEAELYATAARHYRESAGGEDPLPPEIQEKVETCARGDIAFLLKRSRAELEKENFSRARRVAMLAMRRYAGHDAVAEIPDHLKSITIRYEAAKRRDAALARSRKAKAVWDKAESAIAGVERIVTKARQAEVRGLNHTQHFRQSKHHFDVGFKRLHDAERHAVKLNQSRAVPVDLKPRLRQLAEEIITMSIRLRLHVASLYTVRGSYGAALAYVNAALAYDPSDERALAARARIEEAAAVSGRRFFGGRIR